MAGASVIGALRVVLGADTAAFEDGLKGAQAKMNAFGDGMAKAGAAIGAAIAAAAIALGVAIKHTIDEADKLGKMAQKVGLPVEELSALKHAADLSGLSVEELGKSMGKLSKTMVEAAAKPASAAADAFTALGVSVKNSDGTLKSSSEVVSDIAEKFAGLKDGAGKTAVAMAIFGKSGKDMIPLLNSGKEGLQEMKDEALKLGIVIDHQTAKSAEAFNDNLTRLGKVKDSIILKITAGMLPALENLSANLVRTAKDGDTLKLWGESIANMFVSMFNGIERLSLAWLRLGVEWKAFREFMQTDFFSGKLAENWQKFIDAGNETARVLENLRATQDTAHLADAFGDIGKKSAESGKNLKDFNYEALGGKNAIDKFIESTKKSLAAQDAETQTIGMAAGAKEKLRVVLQGLEVAAGANIEKTAALRAKLNELGLSAQDSALKLAGTNLVFANKDPLTLYQTELANTEAAMRRVGATAEELARNQEKVGEKFGMTWSAIGTNIAGTAGALSSLTGTFAKENKAMALASKAFGISQAIINTQIAITKALATLPPPASYFAVALAVAQGAAAVATITAQKGYAKGGSFVVPGGISGTDNMMVPLNLASGEQVDITAANDVGRGRVSEVRVGMRLRDILTGEGLRDMIDALNQGHRDGYRLQYVGT